MRAVARTYSIDTTDMSDDEIRQAMLDVMQPGVNGFSQYP